MSKPTAFQRQLLRYAVTSNGISPTELRGAAYALKTNLPNLSRSFRILVTKGYLNGPHESGVTSSGRRRWVYRATEAGRKAAA